MDDITKEAESSNPVYEGYSGFVVLFFSKTRGTQILKFD